MGVIKLTRSCPLLITMWYWAILLTAVVYTTGDIRMDLFQKAMRDDFPDKKIDMNRLLHEYTTICPYLSECDLDHVEEPAPFVYSRSEVSLPSCKPCDCSYKCMERRNCCPGSPYQYIQYEKVNLIIHSGHYRPPLMAYMITRCPTWYTDVNRDEHTISRCMGNESVLYPTASYRTSLTYKNKFCATCHNETNLQKWKLRSYCRMYFKYQAPSDDVLGKTRCFLTFVHPIPLKRLASERKGYRPITMLVPDERAKIIGTCNVTGLWTEFDHDVNWACENTVNVYQGFKNVFCYICNPSVSSTLLYTLIERCNVTGKWSTYRPEVENACRSQPQTQRLFPFKNIHCMICNGIEDVFNGNTFHSSVEEKVDPTSIALSFQFSTHNSAAFLEEILSIFKAANIPLSNLQKPENNYGTTENVTNIIDHYESICGMYYSCRGTKSHYKYYDYINYECRDTSCSCSKDCAESLSCCAPVLLKYSPYSCISPVSFRRWNANVSNTLDSNLFGNVLVIDKCLTENNVEKHFMFTSEKVSNGYVPNLPVSSTGVYNSTTGMYDKILYKNISYLLCNSDSKTASMDIRLECGSYIDYALSTSIIGLLKLAKEYCSVYLLPQSVMKCNQTKREAFSDLVERLTIPYVRSYRNFSPKNNISEETRAAIVTEYTIIGNETYSKCNQTKQWQIKDTDIEFVCEGDSESFSYLRTYHINGFTYKNFACFICNPTVREDEIDNVISTCNVTGVLSPTALRVRGGNQSVPELCNKMRYHSRWLPFKNYVCKDCNLATLRVTILQRPLEEYDTGSTSWEYPTDIPENMWTHYLQPPAPTVICVQEATTVQKRCHEVMCSANHYLVNDVCVGLYPYSQVVYTVAFELRRYQNPYINRESMLSRQTNCDNLRLRLIDISRGSYNAFTADLFYKHVIVMSLLRHSIHSDTCDDNSVVFNDTNSPTLSFSITYYVRAFRDTNIHVFEKILQEHHDKVHSINVVSTYGGSYKKCKILLHASPTASHMIQEYIHLQNQTEQCQYDVPFVLDKSRQSHLLENLQPHDITIVDRFLICPQIEFGTDEYSYNSTTHTVTITHSRATFELGYFKMLGGAIRVCLDDYKTKIKQVIAKNKAKNEACQSFGKTEIEILLIGIVLAIGTNGMFA